MVGCDLRYRLDLPLDKAESVRLYRRSFELGNAEAADKLGLCHERGDGVELDVIEAVKFYRLAVDRGYIQSNLSLGLFHWRGVGGFEVNWTEALGLWRLGGFKIPKSAADSGSDLERADRFSETDRDGWDDAFADRFVRFGRFSSAADGPSFELWNADCRRSIECPIMPDQPCKFVCLMSDISNLVCLSY
jgi:hypothetical protein